MLTNKKEKVKAELLKAYESYMKARLDFVKETGWNIKSQQIFESTAVQAAERDLFVKQICIIDEKYNSK